MLNGIAAVPGGDEFLLTGKYWPVMLPVRFVVPDGCARVLPGRALLDGSEWSGAALPIVPTRRPPVVGGRRRGGPVAPRSRRPLLVRHRSRRLAPARMRPTRTRPAVATPGTTTPTTTRRPTAVRRGSGRHRRRRRRSPPTRDRAPPRPASTPPLPGPRTRPRYRAGTAHPDHGIAAAERTTRVAPAAHPSPPGPAAEPTTRVGPAAPRPDPAASQPAPCRSATRRRRPPPTRPERAPRHHAATSAARGPAPPGPPTGAKLPRKLTVTRVAACAAGSSPRTASGRFHRAATADGADRSGLTALTYATMMTYAVDAAVAVALANTLFFAAATGREQDERRALPRDHRGPVRGGRAGDRAAARPRCSAGGASALAVSFARRAVLAVVMAFQLRHLGALPGGAGHDGAVKSFVVLKAAVTPRVLPETITLVTTNSRLTTFGLAAGACSAGSPPASRGCGARRARCSSPRLLGRRRAPCCACGSRRGWRSTAGEVPATLREPEPAGPPRAHADGPRRRWSRCGATARSAC